VRLDPGVPAGATPPLPAPGTGRPLRGDTLTVSASPRLFAPLPPVLFDAGGGASGRTGFREWFGPPEDGSDSGPWHLPPGGTPSPLQALQARTQEVLDLGMRLRARTEVGGDWLRFSPCDPSVRFACEPSLIPQLRPDVQFGVELSGTVADRVVVDVDYDQNREFTATNRINIEYRGQAGEFLRSVEVGDVTFDLPDSRFLTRGIPAGNFGLRASAQAGSLELQTVLAQQRGDLSTRTFQLSGGAGAQGFVQEDTLVVDDADYTRGQFFFLSDPREYRGYPHLDVLSLTAADVPPDLLPGLEPIQLYRFANEPVTQQQVEGYIQATGVAQGDGPPVSESGWFRFLQPGVDYFVHPSGLWVALRNPLREDEMLAVTYITAAGDTVGDYNPERLYNAGQRPTLRLLKASGANHQPGRPTWDREMHQIYRVSGSNDVDVGSVDVAISLGELSAGRTFKRAPDGREVTFLKLFGVDEEAPFDRVDRAFLYRPSEESLEDPPPVSGTFLVFPTLRPFQRPPPVPSLALDAEDTEAILGFDSNARIYEDPDPVNRLAGGLFRLTIPFRVRSQGLISSFALGALGIRERSERILLGDRLLVQGQDYLIDYDVGLVTLLDAPALFAANPDAVLRADWEQKPIFQVAPTSVVGMSARYSFGDRGGINLLGLYQSEQALVNRPTLGVEPAAIMLGGAGGDLRFGTSWLDRLVGALPGLQGRGEGGLRISGEVAVSLPDPNTRGDVFLDDFDAGNDLALSLLSPAWQLGSAPEFRDGAETLLPSAVDASDAATLAWQHNWVIEGAAGDSTGVFEGFFPEQIDRQINVAGSPTREPTLLLSFGGRQVTEGPLPQPGARRWRSLTTTLSPTGLDLSRSEYLELYVAAGDSLALLFDLGQVSEDAYFIDQDGQTGGIRPDGRPWGLGILDQEADPRLGEIWSDVADQVGVWGEACEATPGALFRIGDPRANCTVGNGRPDTEDLDEDGILDEDARYIRYVLRLDGSSPYLARDRGQTGSGFRLYRIPLRGPGGISPGGTFTEADWRAVKQLRITITGSRSGAPLLARMRITGSRWVKRGIDGVVAGLAGEVPGMGRLEVASVSRVTEGLAYQAPPGVLEQLDDPTGAIAGRGVEFNEKSLGLLYEGLGAGDRAEVYNRFPQTPRNFLSYRQARFWVVAREGDWGRDRPLTVFFKVGSDDENFYLYRTRLDPALDPGAVMPEDWLPEVVVDFDRWLALRSRAEEQLLADPPTPGEPPLTLWSADSTYAVVLRDRARAPSLASVRELSVGIWNEGELPTSGEVWINELRLGGGVRDPGYAGALNLELDAGGLISSRLSLTHRGSLFRELNREASYLDDQALALNTTISLDRFTPEEWGLEVPLTVSWGREGQDPTFLDRSDIQADRLRGLRETGSNRTRVTLGFRKRTPTGNPLLGIFLDGLDARLGYGDVRSGTVTSEATSRSVDAGVAYRRTLEPRTIPILPDAVLGFTDLLLPDALQDRLEDVRIRWSPERITFSSTYLNQESEVTRYDQILLLPGDDEIRPTRAPREVVESVAEVAFRPIPSLGAEVALLTGRDLLDPEAATGDPGLRPVLASQRSSLGGVDLGWETSRSLRTRLDFQPRFTSWLRTGANWSTRYLSDRNAGYLRRTVTQGDTLLDLQRNLTGQRDLRAVVGVDPEALSRAIGGEEGAPALLGVLGRRMLPLTISWQDALNARFNRAVVDPGAAYQFGWGGADDFRILAGDTASILADRTGWNGSGGARLPGGVVMNLEYAQAVLVTLDARSDRENRTRTWPSVRLSAPDLGVPTWARPLLQRVSLSTGFTVQSTESVVGDLAQLRSREDRVVPVNLSIRWMQFATTSYTGSLLWGTGEDPTGDTERRRQTHGFSLSSSYRPGAEWAERLDRPIQVTLRFAYSDQVDCRITAAREVCTPYVDQLTRDFNLTLDTSISDVDFGIQTSYFDRRSFIGQRLGSTQFQLGVFAQMNFSAGNLARLAGG